MTEYRYEATVTTTSVANVKYHSQAELTRLEQDAAAVLEATTQGEWSESVSVNSQFIEKVELAPEPIDGDNTEMLRAYFATIATARVLVEWPDATYRCDRQLRMPKWAWHRFNDAAFTRDEVPEARDEAQLVWHDPRNVEVSGGNVVGPYDKGRFGGHEGQSGVRIEGGIGFVSNDIEITGAIGDGIYLTPIDNRKRPDGRFLVPKNVVFNRPWVSRTGRDSVAVVAADGATFNDALFESGRNAVIVEPNTDAAYVHDLYFNRPTFRKCRGSTFRAHAGSRFQNFAITEAQGVGQPLEFWVVNNYGNTGERPTGFVYTDNVSDTPPTGGEPLVRIIGADDAHILRNKQPKRAGTQIKHGALLRDSQGSEVADNDWGNGIAQCQEVG